jgi:hypothetical protein
VDCEEDGEVDDVGPGKDGADLRDGEAVRVVERVEKSRHLATRAWMAYDTKTVFIVNTIMELV